MPGDLQEKAIEAAAITLFNYVSGLVAKCITLARNGIGRVFGGRAELGEIEEKEESYEFCPGAGHTRVVGNESRSVSSKRKERGYYNYDDIMIMPSRGLEEDPQRFCMSKYGDDGRFTKIYSTTTPPQLKWKWTYPGTGGSGLPFTFVSFNCFEGGRTCLRFKGTCMGSTTEAVLGTERCKLVHIIQFSPRPYVLTVDAWADSSSGRWTFVFSVTPLPFDCDGLKFFTSAVCMRPLTDDKSIKKKLLKAGRKVDTIISLEYKVDNFSMSLIGSLRSLNLILWVWVRSCSGRSCWKKRHCCRRNSQNMMASRDGLLAPLDEHPIALESCSVRCLLGEREVGFSIEDRFIPATPYERDEVKDTSRPLPTTEMEDQNRGEGEGKGQRRANERDKPVPLPPEEAQTNPRGGERAFEEEVEFFFFAAE